VSDNRNIDFFCSHFCCSLALQSPVSLNIYTQCHDISLTSPVYFIRGGKWHAVPDQEIDINIVMRNYLKFDSRQDILEGVLIYRIQRKHDEFDKSAQDKSKRIHLLVAWHAEHAKGLHVRALLVKHDKKLDEDKLKKLYQKYWYLLKSRINPNG
jgi:hypothetical protein